MNKQDIKALFLANGFKEKQQPDGSTDLNPYVYEAAKALLARMADIYGHPVGNIQIAAAGGAEARTAALFHDRAASLELPVYVMREQRA